MNPKIIIVVIIEVPPRRSTAAEVPDRDEADDVGDVDEGLPADPRVWTLPRRRRKGSVER
ncbi:hypothetical protein GS531_14350 [Rhodococcus hoagii]|nr:hypothetical protein [Prescottella equi]